VWGAGDGVTHQVTDELFNSSDPAWDPEGNYLYFLSDRDYAPQQSRKEPNFASSRNTGIFALALRRDVKHPFPPRSDEVALGEGEAKQEGAKEGAADKPAEAKSGGARGAGPGDVGAAPGDKPRRTVSKPITIDFDGIRGRATRVPVSAENYRDLTAIKGHLLYVRAGAGFNGRDSYARPALVIYSLKDREESVLSEGMADYALSQDGGKVLVSESGKYNLYDAKPKAKDKKTVSTRDLAVDRVPAQEWAEVFEEVWRRYRDFFYVKNMHGYDWRALYDQYKLLLPHVAHRWDLTYVLNEMISELNCSHLYLDAGDFEVPPRAPVGLAGARFTLDERAGRYRVTKIYRGHNEEPCYRSPLTEVGVDARVGDYVLAIDGVELRGDDNPYRLLRHKQHPVTLTLNTRPTMDGARRVTFTPIFSEGDLLYLNWVLGNVDHVARATEGRVGYLHIPDMGAPGAYEFIKWYYPQIRREGLIVDVRSNGGGNISQWIIERLDSKLLGTRFGHFNDLANTYPSQVFHGHMAALISETSASDGDIFPARFKKAGLGPLIGKRTWGGVVGISGIGNLLDGGSATVPLQGTNDTDGSWIIEGYGVDPDIEVTNDPQSVIDGRDLQLERAIAEVMAAMEREPRKLPNRPPDPVKTK
jgi:tricorn protease